MNYIFDTGFLTIRYRFLFPDTCRYFHNYVVPSGDEDADICTSEEEILSNRYGFRQNGLTPFSEYQHLMVKTGNYLLSHDSCMFHGALIRWKDMAVLFTGPSGVGKTTQYRLWRELEGGAVTAVNGDKPILEYNGRQIIAHSSPWNGKEQYGSAGQSAPLRAVVILEQGETNCIGHVPSSRAVVELFRQFIAYPDSSDIIRKEAGFLDAMLDKVPVWKLVNRGDMESVIRTRDALETYYGR